MVIDEVHAFATGKRGDLLALSLARLQTLCAPDAAGGLSATVADPDDYRAWLAPVATSMQVPLVEGEPAAEPELQILLPEGRVPWAAMRPLGGAAADRGNRPQPHHAGLLQHALSGRIHLPEAVGRQRSQICRSASTTARCQKRRGARWKGRWRAGRLRALVCTASLDLGVDWGDIDLVVQMGAPKGSSRLLQRIGRANHRLDEPSKALLVPGNRFEFLEALAAQDAVDEGQRDGEDFRPGGSMCWPSMSWARACAGPFDEAELLAEVQFSHALCLGRCGDLGPRARIRRDRRLCAERL